MKPGAAISFTKKFFGGIMIFQVKRSMVLIALLASLSMALAYPHSARAMDHAQAARDASESGDENAHQSFVNRHVEGHIAFLHAELGITAAQETLWTNVANAMREDVKEQQDAERQVARQIHGQENAIDYLQNRVLFANLRARGEARFLAALQPLYEVLSSSQKHAADDLLIATHSDP